MIFWQKIVKKVFVVRCYVISLQYIYKSFFNQNNKIIIMRCCGCHCNCCCCIWIVIFLTWWFFDWNWIEIAFYLVETVFYYGGKIGWLLYWVWIFIVLGLNFAYQWFMNESLRRRRIYLHEDEDRFYIDIALMTLSIVVAPMLVNWLLIAR